MLNIPEDPAAWLAEEVARFVAESPLNRLAHLDHEPIFEAPLVGYADGDDPLFAQYRAIIGPHHLTPREVLSGCCRASLHPAAPVSVICWVLPIAERTRLSNRESVDGPSERWAHTRTYGEAFNDALRHHVVGLLGEAGHLAVAPATSAMFSVFSADVARPPSSTWSERHALYAAGLGTFGLSEGLITPRGVAHRCGSVVADLALPATPRAYERHTAHCLYYSEGTCGECMARCPAGAITPEGHDKAKCHDYTYGSPAARRWREGFGIPATGCGLCQTGVPCEERVPCKRGRR